MLIVEPEIGEMAQAISKIYFVKDDVYCYKFINGKITDINNKKYLIGNKWFPIYRIYKFSFGGIEILNDKYNHQKIKKENVDYIISNGDKPKRVYVWAV